MTRPLAVEPDNLKEPCVYILASGRDGILYVGVTSQLSERMAEHKDGAFDGFTKRYNVHRLVYFETHETMDDAIRREKQLKKWNRAWKVRLIQEMNPEWQDLWIETGEIRTQGDAGQRLADENEEQVR